MTKKLLFFLLFCFGIVAKAEDMPTSLVVWAKDGTKVAYALAEKPKITFTETDIVITANGIVVNYALDNMDRFTYESGGNTAIRNIRTGKVSFKLDDKSLLFLNLSVNSTVSLRTLDGTLVFSKTIKDSGEYSIPLSGLNSGIYLVAVNGLTYKIVKR